MKSLVLGTTLVQIREKLNFKSARQFYLWLEQHANLDFNYSYYVKIESGKVIPSEKVIQTIAQLLVEEDARRLVIEFCKNLFPNFAYFFTTGGVSESVKMPAIPGKEQPLLRKLKYLTLKQVSIISKSKFHYFLFMVITLARKPIGFSETQKLLHAPQFDQIVADLMEGKIIRRDGENLFSMSKELHFPSETEANMKMVYRQLDEWDREFSAHFNFEPVVQRFLLRRVSPRFIPLLEKQTRVLIESVQMAEELDHNFNTDIVQFNVSFTKGQVAG
jgi:hypothetical protein